MVKEFIMIFCQDRLRNLRQNLRLVLVLVYILKNIMKAHGGKIKEYSNPMERVLLLNLLFQLKITKLRSIEFKNLKL